MFVLPTRFGFAFAALLLVMLIAAVNYELSLGYALVFLLAGLGIMAIFHSFRNLARLRISPGRAAPTFAGETARFGLILTNPDNREKYAIRLRLPGRNPVEVDVPAKSCSEVQLELPAQDRGWLALPPMTLQTTYPLGLIRAWAYAAPMMRCLVYPAPSKDALPLPALPFDDAGDAGLNAGMEDFSALRAHQITDPLGHVAWKAAARLEQGPLLTKLFAGAMARSLWLDWDDLPGEFAVEARLSVLARWICEVHEAGILWGLRLPGTTLSPDKGAAHFHASLKVLALYG